MAYVTEAGSLNIIYIILILLSNGFLIFKNVRKCDFMYKPKTLTILSLAIGDVSMALFPMVVATQYFFEVDLKTLGSSKDYCRLFNFSNIYQENLITFVYGLGLMVLGLQTIQHHRISKLRKQSKIICSMVASSTPWMLGLSIILPLGLANNLSDSCIDTISSDQQKALLVISIILPAWGALITIIFTTISVKCKVKVPNHQAVSNNPQNMATLNVQNSADENNPKVHQQEPIPTDPDNQYLQPLMDDGLAVSSRAHHRHSPQQLYNLPTTQLCALPTRPQYKSQPGHLVAAANPMEPAFTSEEVTSQEVTSQDVTSNSTHKVARLLVISLVYFMLVTPAAFVKIHILMNKFENNLEDLLAAHVALEALSFLPIIRSFMTPIIMFDYSDN